MSVTQIDLDDESAGRCDARRRRAHKEGVNTRDARLRPNEFRRIEALARSREVGEGWGLQRAGWPRGTTKALGI